MCEKVFCDVVIPPVVTEWKKKLDAINYWNVCLYIHLYILSIYVNMNMTFVELSKVIFDWQREHETCTLFENNSSTIFAVFIWALGQTSYM